MSSHGKKFFFLALGVAVIALASFLALMGPLNAKPPKIKNFILISLDDLRADRLGCYGNNRDVSPNIDRLASQGARFLSVYTPYPFTPPAHIAMLASRYPSTYDGILDPETPTLASAMRSYGYKTAAFTGGAFMSTDYGALNGFKEYDDATFDLRSLEKKTTAWLEANRERKFFLFLHTYAVHVPFVAPEPYFQKFADPAYTGPVRNDKESTKTFMEEANNKKIPVSDADRRRIFDIYDAQIKQTDDFIGRLVDTLKSLDLRKNTMILIVSDHGEQLFEFGYFGHSAIARPFAEISTHVPLIISCERLALGREIRPFAELVDIPPTILSAAGLPIPASFQGRSVFPWLSKSFRLFEKRKKEIYYDKIQQAGIRTRRWKLIVDFTSGKAQLFDLKRDPAERNPLPENERRRLVKKLAGKIEAFKAVNDRLNNELEAKNITLAADPSLSPPRFDADTALLAPFDDPSYAYGKEARKVSAVFAQGELPFAAGRFGKGMALVPQKTAALPAPEALKAGIKAVEFWMKITTKKKRGHRLLDLAFWGAGGSLRLQAKTEYSERITFNLNRILADKTARALRFEFLCRFNRWHHLHLAIEPNEVLLFLDGSLIARKKSPLEDFFGPDLSNWELSGAECTLDELRLSTVARITKAVKKKEKKISPQVEERLKALGYLK